VKKNKSDFHQGKEKKNTGGRAADLLSTKESKKNPQHHSIEVRWMGKRKKRPL